MSRKRIRRRFLPPRLDPDLLGADGRGMLGADGREVLRHLEGALADLAGGEGAPPDFRPDRFIAPGVPRIRPVLVLLAARAAGDQPDDDSSGSGQQDASGADVEDTEGVAVAAELLHLAISLHDAALGRQGGRRRRAALRILSGAVGVLGGNHLSLRALELARQAPAPEVIGDLLDAMREVADGHTLAQSVDGRLATSDEAIGIAEAHTGAVFSFACRAGAHMGKADRRVISALGRYGRHTGLAWYLAEDLAALDGVEMARAVALRAGEHRTSFTIGVAGERDPEVALGWRQLLGHSDPDRAADLARRIVQTGAMDESRRRLVRESWTARQALGHVTPSRYRDALDRIAQGIVGPPAPG